MDRRPDGDARGIPIDFARWYFMSDADAEASDDSGVAISLPQPREQPAPQRRNVESDKG
jgi:hypothetical protein